MAHRLDVQCCEYCGSKLPARARTGRPRRFCSNRCQLAAGRSRRAAFVGAPDPEQVAAALNPGEPVEAFLVGHSASTDDQVFAVVHETLLLSITYRRLGQEARPQFAWRCRSMADALDAALERIFKGLGT